MDSSPILSVRNISLSFGGLHALDECSFDVARGSITGVIGPNGAGKSTAFNVISGFLKLNSGKVLYEGQEIQNRAAYRVARTGIGRTFQIPRELKKLTVLENLMVVPRGQSGEKVLSLFLPLPGSRPQQRKIEKRAREVLEIVGMSAKADLEAGLLSGGQKKLLELGRCLMGEPRLLLLDEPTAGVNPTLILQLKDVLRRINAEGVTLVIIEHNMSVIMELCSRVVVMDRGSTMMIGSPKEVQTNPDVLDAYIGGVL